MAENKYNQMSNYRKTKINLPNYYQELSIDQKMFFDELLNDNDFIALEQTRKTYVKFTENLEKMLSEVDNLEASLFPME